MSCHRGRAAVTHAEALTGPTRKEQTVAVGSQQWVPAMKTLYTKTHVFLLCVGLISETEFLFTRQEHKVQ